MSKRTSSRLERMIVELWFWLDEHWRFLVTLLVLAVCLIGLGMLATRDWDQPAVEEDAVIVRFGTTPDPEGDQPHALVRTKDGAILHLNGDFRATLHCRRGSTIRIVRRGSFVSFAGGGCSPPGP